MSKKQLDTLIPDIYGLFDKEHTVNEENLTTFKENIGQVVKDRLAVIQSWDAPSLRVSKLGTPDRKLWYELTTKPKEGDEELRRIEPSTTIKFMYGDIIEELVLLFIKEAGHTVEGEQGEVGIVRLGI